MMDASVEDVGLAMDTVEGFTRTLSVALAKSRHR
jgi:hypothetical protein